MWSQAGLRALQPGPLPDGLIARARFSQTFEYEPRISMRRFGHSLRVRVKGDAEGTGAEPLLDFAAAPMASCIAAAPGLALNGL